MLTKNIYILFPPGYSGTYVSWVLSKSERDSRALTVDDPVNKKNNDQFGGAGTSHLHVRIPTHHGLPTHLSWVLYNRPTQPLIYLINARDLEGSVGHRQASSEEAIMQILNYDPDPVFIHIHDGDDREWRRVANINCITKWPVFFRSEQNFEKIFRFDCFNIETTHTRNVFAEFREKIFPFQGGLVSDFLQSRLSWYKEWYRVRNQYNPHEVNDKTYIVPGDKKINVFELHLRDLMSESLFDFLEDLVETVDCGIYDFSHARGMHPEYIRAQASLGWFDIIERFRREEAVDLPKIGSTMYQSLLLEEMIPSFKSQNIPWRDLSIKECIDTYRKNNK